MKDRIVEASVKVLVQHGLNGWTVDEVARRAGCAKGLVLYHHRSKQHLLEQVATALRDRRWSSRQEAAAKPSALDQLWQTLIDEVNSGRFSAWLSLLAAGTVLNKAARATAEQTSGFAERLGASLGLGGDLVSRHHLIAASLDGLEMRLLEGTPRAELEEDYHRFWLAILER